MAIKIAAIGIITVVSALTVRSERQDIATVIAIAGGAAVLMCVLDGVTGLTDMLTDIAEKTGAGGELVAYLMKVAGAGYIIEFACDTAEDAKLPALANKIAFAGKVVIFCLMLPVVRELINVVVSLSEYC